VLTLSHSAAQKEAARGGGGRLQGGPVRTGRGTCLLGPVWVARTAGGADDAASPGPMSRKRRRREARPPFPTHWSIASGCQRKQSNTRPWTLRILRRERPE